jgi:hypothetical protein
MIPFAGEIAMLKLPVSVALLLAGLGLAGCADSAYLNEHYSRVYYPGENAAAGPDLAVFVFGSPFGQPADQFSGEVIDAMQDWAFAYPTHFVPPSATPPSAYRAVLTFDSKPFGPAVCASPLTRVDSAARIPAAYSPAPADAAPAAPAAPGARVPLTAVLCRGDTYMAWVDGSVPSGGGPESPSFRHGIGQFTASLFPSVNPDQKNHGSFDNQQPKR